MRPSHEQSYERLFHDTRQRRFMLPLRHGTTAREELMGERLERAIGVIYRPETERASHYFHAVLPEQFDEYSWFDESSAVRPLEEGARPSGAAETYPFGL